MQKSLGHAVRLTAIRSEPYQGAELETQVLPGEALVGLEEKSGFVRVRLEDGLAGWLEEAAFNAGSFTPTHRFNAPRGHAYAEPSVKAQPQARLSWDEPFRLLGTKNEFSLVGLVGGQEGYVVSRLLRDSSGPPLVREPLEAALRMLEAPYLWGGVTAWGLDCSGLVQLAYRLSGQRIPRNSAEQHNFGTTLKREEATRGDLVTFPGHIAFYLGNEQILHANGHHMRVSIDRLDDGYGSQLAEQIQAFVRIPLAVDGKTMEKCA